MAESLIFLTEADAMRRDEIIAILQRIPELEICTFDTLALTRKAMRSRMPRLMIGPWSQGGETMLAARASVAGNAACVPVPQALVLTGNVSPARISLTREAGSAELIPCDPLDRVGLFNRITFLLGGANALLDVLGRKNPPALDQALESLPALRRRLVA